MTLEVFLPIIIRDGIPAAMRLWQMLVNKEEVTQEKWDELNALVTIPYEQYINEAFDRANQPGILNQP